MTRAYLLAAAAGLAVLGATAAPAGAATLCVGERRGCFDGLRQALDAAADGDAIRLLPGVYRGGVTIAVSVDIRGAGAGVTRIRGGGPVVTIGGAQAPDPPTVAISGVTISDGVTTAVPAPQSAYGGGVLISPQGATVRIADSVIERNVAAPSATVSSGVAPCPDGPCPYAGGYGGGIFNAGSLTLVGTTVAGNRAGTPQLASDAEGGGIFSRGPLTLIDSHVRDNEAATSPPNARFADGGGVFSQRGGLTIDGGSIAGNRVVLSSAWPSSVDQAAVAGGLHVDGGSSATIRGARIEGNELVAESSGGDATAFGGGIHADGPVAMRDSSVSLNSVRASASGSDGGASADSGGGDSSAATTIAGSRFIGNTATAAARGGTALAAAGGLFPMSFSPQTSEGVELVRSLVAGNRVVAHSDTGAVTARGGGIQNAGPLTLRGTNVMANAVRATGQSGAAAGGGIWNGTLPDTDAPKLTAADSAVTGNVVTADPGVTVRGGGLFTLEPVTLTNTPIRGNRPDQCAGCG